MSEHDRLEAQYVQMKTRQKAREFAELVKLVSPLVSELNNIAYGLEEEGDRTFFGSTNDADRLRELALALDDWRFEHLAEKPA
jgi:chemotaxis regulatin CheY-phosphate phosphatase CheZ